MSADTARLFLGLELSDDARTALDGVRRELVLQGVQGKLHAPSLYHLTLVFLGMTPVSGIPRLTEIMESVPAEPFSLTLSHLGSFKGGSILWAGVQECPSLIGYQARLAAALRCAGFPSGEEEIYRPHITLGRQVKTPVSGLALPPISFPVAHGALFESTRVNGELTYIPLYRSVFH